MADEELLDIVLALKATGLAEADLVNQVLADTGNVAQGVQVQVQGLTAAHEEHAAALQTLNQYTTTYGEQLTAQEARYASLQLSSKEFTAAERDVSSEASAAARAFGSLGSEGAHVMDRFAALGGVMGSGGALGIGIGAALVGGGLVIEMGRSMVANADENEAAQKSLQQAFESQGMYLSAGYQTAIDGFISRNARFISSEYDVKDAFAEAMRAGNDFTMSQRIVNDALDLATIKGISVAEATSEIIRAREGDARTLRDLGITTAGTVDPQKELAKAQKEVATATDEHSKAVRTLLEWEVKHHDRSALTQADLMHEQDLKAKVTKASNDLKNADNDLTGAQQAVKDKGDKANATLDLLEAKTKNARNATTDLKQQQDQLAITWQKMSDDNGPGLESILAGILGGIDGVLNALRNSEPVWGFINGKIDDQIVELHNFLNLLHSIGNEWNSVISALGGNPTGSAPPAIHGRPYGGRVRPNGGRASGGDVEPGETVWVGEEGPELLTMGSSGGHVTSNAEATGGNGEQTELLQQVVDLLTQMVRKPPVKVTVGSSSRSASQDALRSMVAV